LWAAVIALMIDHRRPWRCYRRVAGRAQVPGRRPEGFGSAEQCSWAPVTHAIAADHGEKSYVGSGKLVGKATIITGGDSRIGRAVAIAFALQGADVLIAYLSEDEDAEETKRWLEKAGCGAVLLRGDITQPGHCEMIVETAVKDWGDSMSSSTMRRTR
jgi:hypothetical protein